MEDESGADHVDHFSRVSVQLDDHSCALNPVLQDVYSNACRL